MCHRIIRFLLCASRQRRKLDDSVSRRRNIPSLVNEQMRHENAPTLLARYSSARSALPRPGKERYSKRNPLFPVAEQREEREFECPRTVDPAIKSESVPKPLKRDANDESGGCAMILTASFNVTSSYSVVVEPERRLLFSSAEARPGAARRESRVRVLRFLSPYTSLPPRCSKASHLKRYKEFCNREVRDAERKNEVTSRAAIPSHLSSYERTFCSRGVHNHEGGKNFLTLNVIYDEKSLILRILYIVYAL